jgi:hypothetical protein
MLRGTSYFRLELIHLLVGGARLCASRGRSLGCLFLLNSASKEAQALNSHAFRACHCSEAFNRPCSRQLKRVRFDHRRPAQKWIYPVSSRWIALPRPKDEVPRHLDEPYRVQERTREHRHIWHRGKVGAKLCQCPVQLFRLSTLTT